MLNNFKKSYTITAQSVVDKTVGEVTTRVVAEGYSAEINSDNPEDVRFSEYQQDKAAYKDNRIKCSQDRMDFQDMVYAIQDQLIAEKAAE